MLLTVVLEKTLESPLDCKDIKPVHPKGNQSWIFIGRTDAEARTPILWPPEAKNWFLGKDPDAGKDWRQEEKGMTEDEMVGWHHWLDGHEFEQTPGVGDGQGSLACCRAGGCIESDTTEQLNWTESLKYTQDTSMDLVRVHILKIRINSCNLNAKNYYILFNISFENDIIFRCEVYALNLLRIIIAFNRIIIIRMYKIHIDTSCQMITPLI